MPAPTRRYAPAAPTPPHSDEKDRLRERMEAIYGMNGQARDALTDYSTPASGSFYFTPSVDILDGALA